MFFQVLYLEIFSVLFLSLHYKTCESNFTDDLFTAVFNPLKKNNAASFPKTILPRSSYIPNQDKFERFLKKLPEAKEISEQFVFVFSAIDELFNKQQFLKTPETDKNKRAHTLHFWLF